MGAGQQLRGPSLLPPPLPPLGYRVSWCREKRWQAGGLGLRGLSGGARRQGGRDGVFDGNFFLFQSL